MLERCSPWGCCSHWLHFNSSSVLLSLTPWSHRLGFTKLFYIVGNKASYVARQNWSSAFGLCLYGTLWSAVCLSVCSSPPCAPRAFPWECGLLFRTPGIASGVLLVRLMWAKQRGNKDYRNLQIIAELKTSHSFTQAHKDVSLGQTQADTPVCVHSMPCAANMDMQ